MNISDSSGSPYINNNSYNKLLDVVLMDLTKVLESTMQQDQIGYGGSQSSTPSSSSLSSLQQEQQELQELQELDEMIELMAMLLEEASYGNSSSSTPSSTSAPLGSDTISPTGSGSSGTTPTSSGAGTGTTSPTSTGSGTGTTSPTSTGSGTGTTSPTSTGSGTGTTSPTSTGSGTGTTSPTSSGTSTSTGSLKSNGSIGAPASASQPANSVNVADYGAVGNGSTDDTQAIQSAVNAAQAQGKSVYIPAGTYNYSGVISANGVKIQGAGSGTVLNSTNANESAIKLTGNGAGLSDLQVDSTASSRSSQPDAASVLVQNATNASVTNVTVQGASSNGIRLDNASGSTISGNLVQGTDADGIALMNGSTGNKIVGNEVYQAGDDSFSDDSYSGDAKQDSGNIFSNDLALDNRYGRGFALMGSSGDTVENSVVDGEPWVGIMAGTDSNSGTMTGSNDTIDNNLTINTDGAGVSAAGMSVSDNSTSGSFSDFASILGFAPATSVVDAASIDDGYVAGTGSGADNSGGTRS